MLERVPMTKVIESAVKSGLTNEEADQAVERMIRDGIIFMTEAEKGPSF